MSSHHRKISLTNTAIHSLEHSLWLPTQPWRPRLTMTMRWSMDVMRCNVGHCNLISHYRVRSGRASRAWTVSGFHFYVTACWDEFNRQTSIDIWEWIHTTSLSISGFEGNHKHKPCNQLEAFRELYLSRTRFPSCIGTPSCLNLRWLRESLPLVIDTRRRQVSF